MKKIIKNIGLAIHEIGRLILKIGFGIMSLSKYIYRPAREIESARIIARDKYWHSIHGDTTLRFDYPLTHTSVIFDLGGYHAEWAIEMLARYNPEHIYIFEPVEEFFKYIQNRFKKNEKIHVFHFGLGAKNSTEKISVETASSSIYKADIGPKEEIEIVDIKNFFETKHIGNIDLMKINIEGGEYDLLDRLITTGLVGKIDNIQVQFHEFVPNAKERMQNIQKKLSKTHTPTYQYEFIWENWKRNNV